MDHFGSGTPARAAAAAAAAAMAAPAAVEPATVVDRLIAERAPGLTSTRAGRWLLEELLYRLLDYRTAVELAGRIRDLPGHAVLELLQAELALSPVAGGLEHVPPKGRAIAVANHPTGLADGIAVHRALRRVRPDVLFLANADAARAAPGLADVIVPVEWVQAKRSHGRTREMLQRAARAFEAEALLVVFPSGRLSRLTWRGIRERPWQPTVIGLARKFDAPILPMRLVARNSALFYTFSQLSRELRDITLFHELLNKRGRPFEIHVAPPLNPDELDADPPLAVGKLQRYVERGLRGRPVAAAGAPRRPARARRALPVPQP